MTSSSLEPSTQPFSTETSILFLQRRRRRRATVPRDRCAITSNELTERERSCWSMVETASAKPLDMDDDTVVAEFMRSHAVRGFMNDRAGRTR